MDSLINSKRKEIKIGEIEHSLTERLAIAVQSHILARNKGIPITDKKETLDAARFLFRGFLERMIQNSANLDLPEGIGFDKLSEIYGKSDFDWSDYEKLSKFTDWYSSYTGFG